MSTTFTGLVPIFAVRDVAASKDFYVDQLGFILDYIEGDPPTYACLYKDKVELHLIDAAQPHSRQEAGNGYLSILTDGVDDLHQKLVTAGVNIETPPEDRPYGLRDFIFRDADRNAVIISCPLKSK